MSAETKVVPVIMCGGYGERLWPLSQKSFPKQFLNLTGDRSLFQILASRLEKLRGDQFDVMRPCVVGNEEHRFLITDQLQEQGWEPVQLILEPSSRNTAATLTLAAMAAIESVDDPLLLVCPADQSIKDNLSLKRAIESAITEARKDSIVIFGVKPTRPDTGFGYICTDDDVAPGHVTSFVEKPDIKRAQQYLQEGSYFWNSGMLVLKASLWLKALKMFRPDILEASQRSWDMRGVDGLFVRPEAEMFSLVPIESIDRAVLEKCVGSVFKIRMVALEADWSDLGSWDSIWGELPKDEKGNALRGTAFAIDTKDTLVYASTRQVGVVGASDLIVVETPDAVLVADRSRSQQVKSVSSSLKALCNEENVLHRKIHRPWGWYKALGEETPYKVKHIRVNPGASLSLQRHEHRSEHWVIIKGIAEITQGDRVTRLYENQSTFISVGEIHRLHNPGDTSLEIIEVQVGDYLGEDDIVRIEDQYGRHL